MQTADVMREFEESQAILRGHFILSSGLHSDTYLQCARVLMDAKRAARLCSALAEKVNQRFGQNAFDVVVAPAMGGVVVGYEMARQLELEGMFCERVDGSFTLRRGFHLEPNQRVLVVEDVVTTGKSSRETFACIERFGALVIGEASLIDRSGGKAEAELGVPLVSLMTLQVPTYTEETLPHALTAIPAVKPGSRFLQAKAS